MHNCKWFCFNVFYCFLLNWFLARKIKPWVYQKSVPDGRKLDYFFIFFPYIIKDFTIV